MGIWDRLGSVINSYINDFAGETSSKFGGRSSRRYSSDPDLDSAYEELDDFLNNRKSKKPQSNFEEDKSKLPPEELRADFECLGVPFGADLEACKAAYKRLLKIHHPDRHAGHEGNFKKATEKSARINSAYDRIEKWYNKSTNYTNWSTNYTN